MLGGEGGKEGGEERETKREYGGEGGRRGKGERERIWRDVSEANLF